MSEEPVDFVAKLAELRAKKGLVPPSVTQPPASTQNWDTDVLLPDLGGPELTDADKELDQFVDNIDIIDAYNMWCSKMVPNVGGKRESIMISCPNPAHPDKDPSAWINLDKQTWYCGGCNEGGDAHDIAALNLGYPVPGYKQGETFHQLREQMAESFGFRTKKVAGGKVSWIEDVRQPVPQDQPVPQPDGSTPAVALAEGSSATGPTPEQGEADNISEMWADDEGEELVIYPTIDWQKIIPEETFLYEYMKACTNDDSPEEYHFWHGLMALGLACGRNVTLDDTRPVYGNLMVCVMGATGTGKSRSRGWMNDVLAAATPYHEDGTATTGVKVIPVPGSGEYLVSQFSYEGKDPANGKSSLGFQRVVGVVDFDEMSALLARANRTGATLKPTIMQLADATRDVRIGGLRSGDFIAHEPFCTITASTQPKAIRHLLTHADTGSGFLNRWIFAGGKSKEIEALGGSRSNIKVVLDEAIQRLKEVRGWGAIERSIEMEDDAYETYLKFFRARIEPAKTQDETDLLKRIDLITKKIMLLLAINQRKSKVTIEIVRAMMPLFDYVIECYGILNSNIGVSQMQDVMMEIQRHIHRHQERTGRGASANDLVRYTKRKNYSLEQIKKALEVMSALDIIELESKSKATRGRPTIRYRVVGE